MSPVYERLLLAAAGGAVASRVSAGTGRMALPFCRWDGGGEHEVSPDVPAPAVSR